MHKAVGDGGGHGADTQVPAPILHEAVGCDDDGSVQLVAPVHQGLQQRCGVLADATSREQVVGHQQIGRHPALEPSHTLIAIACLRMVKLKHLPANPFAQLSRLSQTLRARCAEIKFHSKRHRAQKRRNNSSILVLRVSKKSPI